MENMTALFQYHLQGNILKYKTSIQIKAMSQILYYGERTKIDFDLSSEISVFE